MAYDIYVLDESNITLSNAGLDGVTQGDGTHMIGQTITLASDAWYPVSINDSDADFEDNDPQNDQTLAGTQTIDGVTFADGTPVEAEYALVVSDGTNTYTVVAFNVNNSAPSYATVEGLAFIGGPGGFPPVGVPLTVMSAIEFPVFEASTYATPICFASGTLIGTPEGNKPIEDIGIGDLVTTRNGPKPVRWRAHRCWPAFGNMAPVLFEAGAIGNVRPLRLSQQHRVVVRGWKAELFFGTDHVLVAAKHLVNGRNILIEEGGVVTYHHLMFDDHQILISEGVETESYFLGDDGIACLRDAERTELQQVFPELRRSLTGFGPTAATVLRAREAPVVCAA